MTKEEIFESAIKWKKEKTEEGTLYVYESSDTRTCLIKNDRTMEIRVNGLLSKYPTVEEIAELKNTKELLQKIQNARLCEGTKEGYGCQSILFPVGARANTKAIRCAPCQMCHQAERRRQKRKREYIDVSGESEAERACVVQNCPGRDSGTIRLYAIPKYDIVAWCENLKLNVSDVKADVRVCSRHFEETCKNPRTLKIGARPTLNLGHADYKIQNDKLKRRTTIRVCCIVGCDVTSLSHSLFPFPEEHERLKQWLLICVIKDYMVAHKRKYICSKHFEPSMLKSTKMKSLSLKRNAVPKMDALSWLENNTNTKVDDLKAAASKRKKQDNSIELAPEVQAMQEIQNALISKLEIENNFMHETKSTHETDSFEGLQCENVCLTCAKAFKDCETYQEACFELEKQLEELHAKTDELRTQNDILMAELESDYVVYQDDVQ